MAKIVRFHEPGDASVLKIEDVPPKEPNSAEVRIKISAFALNRAFAKTSIFIHLRYHLGLVMMQRELSMQLEKE